MPTQPLHQLRRHVTNEQPIDIPVGVEDGSESPLRHVEIQFTLSQFVGRFVGRQVGFARHETHVVHQYAQSIEFRGGGAWLNEAHVVDIGVGNADGPDPALINLLIDDERQSLETLPVIKRYLQARR